MAKRKFKDERFPEVIVAYEADPDDSSSAIFVDVNDSQAVENPLDQEHLDNYCDGTLIAIYQLKEFKRIKVGKPSLVEP